MINYISKNKKAAMALLIVLLIGSFMLSLTSVATPVLAESNNQLTNMANVQPRMLDDILESGSGTEQDPYFETDWYGRILVTYRMGSEKMLQINIDPRERGIINDDIIIEYRYYKKSSFGTETNVKLNEFMAYVTFCDSQGNVLNTINFGKANDSTAGFTRSSGATNVAGVEVIISFNNSTALNNYQYRYFQLGVKP